MKLLRTTALTAALMTAAVMSLTSPALAQDWGWGWRGGGWGRPGASVGALATRAVTDSAIAARSYYGYGYGYPAYSYSYGTGFGYAANSYAPAYAGYSYPAYAYGYGTGYGYPPYHPVIRRHIAYHPVSRRHVPPIVLTRAARHWQ